MSASPPTISMLEEEDTQIYKHEIAIERVNKEWQRQWEEEAQKAVEAKKAQREVVRYCISYC